MRAVFAGTPEFAARALSALIAAGHEIPLVLTQPDRPAGRGMRTTESAVKRLAREHAIAVFQPAELRSPEHVARIAESAPEVLVVAAYGLILPAPVLGIARHGAVNIHASLLPRWRGAAPIQRALLAGDRETGITIMRMDAGLDTGPIVSRTAIPIGEDDDAGSLHDRLAVLGAQCIVAALEALEKGTSRECPQPEDGASYARKLGREDRELDWHAPAERLERAVRAMRPSPGASTLAGDEILKIWRAELATGAGAPGSILSLDASGVVVACGEGALRVTELQRAGGRRLSAAEFARGKALAIGSVLGPRGRGA